MSIDIKVAVLAACIALEPAAFAQQKRVVPAVTGKGRKIALVVGNKDYREHPLTNPLNDADDMKKGLEDLGFQVQILKNANLESLLSGVDSFTQSLQEGDVVLFYYSGHGIAVQSRNYLIPVDFNGTSEASVRARTISADEVQQAIEDRKPQLAILVLDACRDNPFLRSKGIGAGGLAAPRDAKGTLIAFAAGPGEAAIDSADDRNSLYTKYLLSALRQPGLSVRDLFDQVAEQVHEASGEKITPSVYRTLIGNLVFRPGDPAIEASRERFAAIRDTKDPALLEQFLRDFPSHPDAGEATARLQQLRRQLTDEQRQREQARLRKEDDDFWAQVKASGALPVIDIYLNQFPSGAHAAEARKLRDDLSAAERAKAQRQAAELSRRGDDAAWELARAQNTRSAYQSYLRTYSEHSAEAQELLAKLPAPGIPAAPPAVANSHAPHRNPRDKSEYVWVPGGTFQGGCRETDPCGPEEPRRHTVTLPDTGFWMGQTEVTVKAYRDFADATKRRMPPASDDNPKWNYTDHPMIKASWKEAKAYCEWAGGRLPTGDEWERAARGGADTRYPWGDDIQPSQAKYIKSTAKTGAVTSPVKSFEPNGYGLFDVAGNAWEWTSDIGANGLHLARGGSWDSAAKSLQVISVRTFKNDEGFNQTGFRCLLPQKSQTITPEN
jgi:formylglycine-generating enzyme required for sulfatase activity